MIKFLKRPYPFNTDLIHNAKIIFFISVIFGLFLFFLQPFNLNELGFSEKLTISGMTAIITFAILSFNLLVLPSYFTKIFTTDKWNILKEIIWNTILISELATGYFFYFKYANIGDFTGLAFVRIVIFGVVPITILVFFNQNRLLKMNLSDAVDLNKKILSKMNSENNTVLFESEYKNDSISLIVNTITLIKSAGNYIEIFWKDKNKTNKHIVRMKMQEAEDLLKNYNFIFKCHRTFLVNTHQIQKAQGNSQGLRLSLSNIDFQVPVSRPYVSKLKEVI
ncbi:MAG: LytTR family transcriptional regulator DNA-binding domain-containing protein [Bacteroidales bacterium]|nr:LytTR family transcriptional regulator DNA-binding domain-containing protein [Bacteroidales bacterium]